MLNKEQQELLTRGDLFSIAKNEKDLYRIVYHETNRALKSERHDKTRQLSDYSIARVFSNKLIKSYYKEFVNGNPRKTAKDAMETLFTTEDVNTFKESFKNVDLRSDFDIYEHRDLMKLSEKFAAIILPIFQLNVDEVEILVQKLFKEGNVVRYSNVDTWGTYKNITPQKHGPHVGVEESKINHRSPIVNEKDSKYEPKNGNHAFQRINADIIAAALVKAGVPLDVDSIRRYIAE